MKSTKWIIALLVVAFIAFAGGIASQYMGFLRPGLNRNNAGEEQNNNYGYNGGNNSQPAQGFGNRGYGMMGGYQGYGMMGGFNGYNSNTINEDQVQKDMNASLQSAKINKADNSITYADKDIKLVMLGGPEEADGKFVIGGMVNPTLYIPKGASVTIELVNEDEGMPHGVEITNGQPPYPYMAMMQGQIYPGSLINPVAAAKDNNYAEAETTFNAGYTGTFYYICQYPGHAQNGMYGKIVIE